ncbi:DNA mismatch endonuclease Vsr [Mesorhizobium sp. M4B.F.Ca.ET.169.01.1.1]|uniref:very short patch repair endonuclease n=1 Tax=unclassified Mesorhizobium TaxID=325217 RepID=UPI000FCA58F8|nr:MULTISPECIES: very short patch repair endonuclease [unclassified Mesorhizobium]RVD46256.1 DNA mismatch endonuclease Vsr [Mesorhizobium sp. M4B.F.Ca.ET.019.03.1.1]TGT41942.1 DNA mismatch endonuclease Vsr [Mesorhizobium sp. M4B.F.Ca.ET.169.01.1.1]
MTDTISSTDRSKLMGRIRNKNTGPELAVRKALHAAGFRFRLHRRDLPGRPDIVLPRLRLAIFVHGCFWHGHDCRRGKLPDDNAEFWVEKIDRNKSRDVAAQAALSQAGWTVETIWQCQLKNGLEPLIERLRRVRERRSRNLQDR